MMMMIMKHIKEKLIYLLHRIGFHNSNCRRRIYTTEQDCLCLITGNTHKKFQL